MHLSSLFRKSPSELDRFFFSRSATLRSYEHLFRKKSETAPKPGDLDPGVLSFQEFSRDHLLYRRALISSIRDGTYEPRPAEPYEIIVDKSRTVYRFDWPDHYLMTHLALAIQKVTANELPDCLFSFRAGRGNLQALKRVQDFVRAYPPSLGKPLYVARRDVRNYGERMKHEWLMSDFARYTGASPELSETFRKFCRFPYAIGDSVVSNWRGLPTGSHLQIVFENLYLLDLDRDLEKIDRCLYLRFGDDILFVSDHAPTYRRATEIMAARIQERGLEFKQEKTLDLVLLKPHELPGARSQDGPRAASEFEYLGMKVDFSGRIRLPSRKQREVTAFLKKRLSAVNHLIPPQVSTRERIRRLICGVRSLYFQNDLLRANLVRSRLNELEDEAELADLDRWVALLILKLAIRKGCKKGLFRTYPYGLLREMGLPSLRHLKRTREI